MGVHSHNDAVPFESAGYSQIHFECSQNYGLSLRSITHLQKDVSINWNPQVIFNALYGAINRRIDFATFTSL